jgi:hypothetical protein
MPYTVVFTRLTSFQGGCIASCILLTDVAFATPRFLLQLFRASILHACNEESACRRHPLRSVRACAARLIATPPTVMHTWLRCCFVCTVYPDMADERSHSQAYPDLCSQATAAIYLGMPQGLQGLAQAVSGFRVYGV